MTTLDALGHAGYVLIFIGMWWIGCRPDHPGGWRLRCVGELWWAVLGIWLHLTSVVFWGVGFAILDLQNLWSRCRRMQRADVRVHRKLRWWYGRRQVGNDLRDRQPLCERLQVQAVNDS